MQIEHGRRIRVLRGFDFSRALLAGLQGSIRRDETHGRSDGVGRTSGLSSFYVVLQRAGKYRGNFDRGEISGRCFFLVWGSRSADWNGAGEGRKTRELHREPPNFTRAGRFRSVPTSPGSAARPGVRTRAQGPSTQSGCLQYRALPRDLPAAGRGCCRSGVRRRDYASSPRIGSSAHYAQ